MSPLSLAIAGTGAMASYHVRRFGQFPEVSLVACYDRHLERAQAFQKAHKLGAAYDSLEKMLEKEQPDALAVAVADAEHYAVSRRALERGVPLFVEKPLATTLEEAELLGGLDCAIPVVCNFSKLNYPAIFGALHLIRYGALGRLRRLELSYFQSWIISTVWGEWWKNPRWLWRISSTHGGGGALRDLGSHLFYLLLGATGGARIRAAGAWSEADRNLAAGTGFSCDMNDTFEVQAACGGGIEAVVRGSYASPGQVNNVILEAECEAGSMSVDLARSKDELLFTRGSGSRAGETQAYRFSKVYSTYAEFLRLIFGRWENSHWFAPPSLKDGIEVQRLISNAEEASRKFAQE